MELDIPEVVAEARALLDARCSTSTRPR